MTVKGKNTDKEWQIYSLGFSDCCVIFRRTGQWGSPRCVCRDLGSCSGPLGACARLPPGTCAGSGAEPVPPGACAGTSVRVRGPELSRSSSRCLCGISSVRVAGAERVPVLGLPRLLPPPRAAGSRTCSVFQPYLDTCLLSALQPVHRAPPLVPAAASELFCHQLRTAPEADAKALARSSPLFPCTHFPSLSV